MPLPTRFQFNLRTLLAVVTLCGGFLAVVTAVGLDFVLGFSGLLLSWGFVLLLAWFTSTGLCPRLTHTQAIISTPVLYGSLTFAFYIFGEAIDQPHPGYFNGGNWLTKGVADGVPFALFAAIGMLIVVAIDGAIQTSRPRDSAYYPRLANVRHGLSSLHVRLLLIVGGSLILVAYGESVVTVWLVNQRPHGWVWPPKRVFAACHLLWGLLWLADCASRPRRGTMAAAIGYLSLGLLLPTGGGVLVE